MGIAVLPVLRRVGTGVLVEDGGDVGAQVTPTSQVGPNVSCAYTGGGAQIVEYTKTEITKDNQIVKNFAIN